MAHRPRAPERRARLESWPCIEALCSRLFRHVLPGGGDLVRRFKAEGENVRAIPSELAQLIPGPENSGTLSPFPHSCAVATNGRCGKPDEERVAFLPSRVLGGSVSSAGPMSGPFRLHRTVAATSPAGRRRSSLSWAEPDASPPPGHDDESPEPWGEVLLTFTFRRTTGTEANLAPWRSLAAPCLPAEPAWPCQRGTSARPLAFAPSFPRARHEKPAPINRSRFGTKTARMGQ